THVAFSGAVATFTDTYAGNTASDFAASIDWGDGATTSGTVSGGSGTFTVSGSHTYTGAGSDSVKVTLTDDAPGTATATATTTATVTAGSLSGTMVLTSATEHVALTGTTTVATFTDTNNTDVAGGFTASINWGDGTSSAGTVSGASGAFTVSGGHTYSDEGSDSASVTITRISDNASTAPSGTVTVAEHDALTAHATSFAATTHVAFSGAVATFTDTDTITPAGDFIASIDWGDGTSSTGTVSGGSGTFTVSGGHTFTAAASDSVKVTLTDDAPGTATATATTIATVSRGVLASTMVLTAATEGTALAASTTIATFTDTDPVDPASDFTATINWGDGTSTAGTVSGSGGVFTVTGGHTYADEGSDAASVVITRTDDARTTTPSGSVAVAEGDALTPHGITINATANVAFNGTVATFTDTYTGNTSGDFTASIDWGDGTTTAGTVSGGSGTFTVSGGHTYAAGGSDSVKVTLTDDTPGTATA